MIQGRITASHVGVGVNGPVYDKRTCIRCGMERSTSARSDRSKPFMCGDCKSVDKAMAKRLGLK